MSASRKPDRVLGATLLVAAVALAGLTAYEWQAGQGLKAGLERQVRSGTARPAPLDILPPFELQPLSAYSGIVQHPLFTPSREPAPAASASAAPPRKLVLTGIANNAAEAVVLIKDLQTGQTERLRAGIPDADGLELQSVEGTTAVFKQGNAKLSLDLQVAPSPGAVGPARTAAATGVPPQPPKPTVDGVVAPELHPSTGEAPQSPVSEHRAPSQQTQPAKLSVPGIPVPVGNMPSR